MEDVPEGSICRRRGAVCCFVVRWRGRSKNAELDTQERELREELATVADDAEHCRTIEGLLAQIEAKRRIYIGPSFEHRFPLEDCELLSVKDLFRDRDDMIVQMAEGDFVVSLWREGEPFFPGSTVIERVEGGVRYYWRVREAVHGDWAAARLAVMFSGFVYSEPATPANYEESDDSYAF
jgi:hypothetical protein